MSDVVISIENVSKLYRLGVINTGTFGGDLQRWWARLRGLPDPHLTIKEKGHHSSDGQTIWALRDINFTIRRGEAVGVIGRNGAGKSTLLKILSRVIAPTSGMVRAKGKIASLLEVGTGFHPELTGRENIFMNAAILGMSRAEVQSKFDEIVDFSGVEKYIDTPVKRYSSGMYVRLAFAVAAHLEPDILVVDEVLAVGDIAFQKKSLGKMNDVTGQGRTILFVSHNMGAIQQICPRAVLLDEGVVSMDGPSDKVVSKYLGIGIKRQGERIWPDVNQAPGDEVARLRAVRILDRDNKVSTEFDVRDPITIEMEFWVFRDLNYLDVSFYIENDRGTLVLVSIDNSHDTPQKERKYRAGLHQSRCYIPPDFLNNGQFLVQVNLTEERLVHTICRDATIFNVADRMDPQGARGNYHAGEWPPSAVRPKLEWSSVHTPLEKELIELPGPVMDRTNKG